MISQKENTVLSTIAVVLVVLWLLALATSSPLGGAVHGVLLIAGMAVALRLIEGRYPCAAQRVLNRTAPAAIGA